MWTPPTIPNGAILTYTLIYAPIDEPGLARDIISSGNDTDFVLTELRPFTNYTLSISASTSAGEGPSDTVFAMTTEDCE